MKYCITGGLGFIGNEVVRQCQKEASEIFIVDNKNRIAPDIEDLQGIKLYEADIRNFEALDKIISQEMPDCLIHLAAIHYIPECNENPTRTYEVNVGGTLNLLRVIEKYKIPNTLIASSGAVYADSPETLTENNSTVQPVDIYGLSKLHAEDLAHLYHLNNPELKFTLFRLFNTYGPRETNPHIIPEIINQLKTGTMTLSLGNITTRRDMIYVEDVAKAIISISKRSKGENMEVINLCSGFHASMEELINIISQKISKSITVAVDETRIRKIDKLIQVGSNNKLHELTGFRPEINLNSGVELLLGYEKVI